LGREERCSESWCVMDWLRALNFWFMGRPEAAFTFSDHFVRISSCHGWNLGSVIFYLGRGLLIVGFGYFHELGEIGFLEFSFRGGNACG
jgi:ribosome biogenesis protein Nip4